MKYHFPLIKPKVSIPMWQMLLKLEEEMAEFQQDQGVEAKKKEAIDILHVAETLVRKFFNDDAEFERIKALVTKKNKDRGYYK